MTQPRSHFMSDENCFCFNLRRAARVVTRTYDEALSTAGLTATQYSALAVLAAHGELTMIEFAKAMETDRTTLTRNLGLLEEERLVKRSVGADRRKRLVALTPKGRRRFQKARPYWKTAQANILKALGASASAGLLARTSEIESTLSIH